MKRLFDIVVSAVAMLLLSPLFVLLSLLILLTMGLPILFVQERPGRSGRVFRLMKFRTMRLGSASTVDPETDSGRLTPLGSIMRLASLDELPELWNVLRGDMSLVGPRPLLVEYLPLYSKEQVRRHEVRPGITGWAQVHGRNAIPWERRFELDVWYVDHRSMWLDLRILVMTVRQVFRVQQVSAEGHATQGKFRGTTGGGVSGGGDGGHG
ncbi:MAG: sugar transferase [Phycisphaerales bacterium]|nr:sugar transferase [Phycisphaerales bacterium]